MTGHSLVRALYIILAWPSRLAGQGDASRCSHAFGRLCMRGAVAASVRVRRCQSGRLRRWRNCHGPRSPPLRGGRPAGGLLRPARRGRRAKESLRGNRALRGLHPTRRLPTSAQEAELRQAEEFRLDRPTSRAKVEPCAVQGLRPSFFGVGLSSAGVLLNRGPRRFPPTARGRRRRSRAARSLARVPRGGIERSTRGIVALAPR
mmetsp:Transcript_74151/g.199931  ORF Transcript_74151/g.199931 Transcript_74151/m.199931 type:complete len:204 (-) Transcript_74151:392-1003(-)